MSNAVNDWSWTTPYIPRRQPTLVVLISAHTLRDRCRSTPDDNALALVAKSTASSEDATLCEAGPCPAKSAKPQGQSPHRVNANAIRHIRAGPHLCTYWITFGRACRFCSRAPPTQHSHLQQKIALPSQLATSKRQQLRRPSLQPGVRAPPRVAAARNRCAQSTGYRRLNPT